MVAQLGGNDPEQQSTPCSQPMQQAFLLTPLSRPHISNAEGKTQHSPVRLLCIIRFCRPVNPDQLEGNAPAKRYHHAASTFTQPLCSHTPQPPTHLQCRGRTQHLPVRLLCVMRRVSKPVSPAQLEGNEPGHVICYFAHQLSRINLD